MLQIIFGLLLGCSCLYGLARGQGERVASAALGAAGDAVEAAIAMAGGFAFFCGLMEILRRAGAVAFLARHLAAPLRKLMGNDLPDDALEPVTLNLTANLLGLGNAATPMGIAAAKRMAAGDRAGNALCLFLVINASSVQLMPTSVIALRAAAGSSAPGAVVWPAFLATLCSTAVGVLACKIAEKKS